jgi:rhodanese-related sulfurtransferase
MEQHSITVDDLHSLLDSREKVLLFDVRQPLDLLANPEIIPGTQRLTADHNPFSNITSSSLVEVGFDLSGSFFFEVDHDGHARNTWPLSVADCKRFDVDTKFANKRRHAIEYSRSIVRRAGLPQTCH